MYGSFRSSSNKFIHAGLQTLSLVEVENGATFELSGSYEKYRSTIRNSTLTQYVCRDDHW